MLPAVQWDLLGWIAACAVALSWLASRVARPHLSWRACAGLAVVALAPELPALERGMVYGPLDTNVGSLPWADAEAAAQPKVGRLNDVTLQFVPWQETARRAMLAGRWPLFDPFAGAGQPLLGNGQSAPFSLVSWLALPFEAPRAQVVRGFVKLLLALLGAFAAARFLGASAPFATLAAIAYAGGGSISMWKLFPHAEVMALWPFAFLASERLLAGETGRAPRVLLIGALACMGVAGHPETLLAAVAVLGARWTQWWIGQPRATRALRRPGRAMLCGVLAAGLSLPATLPLLERVLESEKFAAAGGAAGEDEPPRAAAGALATALTQLIPGVFGAPQRQDEVGPVQLHLMGEGAEGLVVWMLAVGAWPLLTRGSAWRFLAGVVVVAGLALTFPGPAHWLLARCGLGALAPRYLAYLGGFGVALLAARGAQRLWTSDAGGRGAVVAAGGAIAVAVLAVPLARALRLPAAPELLARWSGDATRTTLITAAAVAGAALAIALRRRIPSSSWLLSVAIALPLLRAFAGYTPTVGATTAYPPLAPVRAVRTATGPFRILGTRGVFFANNAAEYGLQDVRIHDPTAPGWYLDWLEELLDVDRSRYKKQYLQPRSEHLPALRLLGVRFLFAGPADLGPPWLDRGRFGRTRLWELPGEVRWAFFPSRVSYVDTPAAARAALRATLRDGGDAAAQAAIEARGAAPVASSQDAPRVEGIDVDGDRLRVRVALARDAWLVVSQAAVAGWRATGDGRALEVRRAYGALLAVRVPAGTRVVRLRYLPGSFVVGCWAAAGAVLLGAWWCRRPAVPPTPV